MKSSFFIADDAEHKSRKGKTIGSKNARKRAKGTDASKQGPAAKRPRKAARGDEAISSDEGEQSEADQLALNGVSAVESDDDDRETAAEKRIRLAKAYLEHVEADTARRAAETGFDAGELERDLIADRLRHDALETKGRLWRPLAGQYLPNVQAPTKFPRGHQLSITSIVVTPDRKWIYTGGKDGAIIKWNAETMAKAHVFLGLQKNAPKGAVGHTREVTCLAASPKYLASGGNDARLNVWNVADDSHVRVFTGHRDSLTGLCFRKGTHHLYSSSRDRTVKTWNLDEMTYVETLFGHQEAVTCIDTVSKERCVTGGGRDKTMRLWKIVEESQLVFRGSSSLHGSLDTVYQATEDYFLSGDDRGTLSLWHTSKKKAAFSLANAHGLMPLSEAEKAAEVPPKPYWISSITGVKFSDLFFTGSWNGEVKCWRLHKEKQSFELVSSIPIPGVINSMAIVEPTDYPLPVEDNFPAASIKVLDLPGRTLTLVVGTGQEHKDGRWWNLKEARNVMYAVKMLPSVAASKKA